jgi:hypothetical protein
MAIERGMDMGRKKRLGFLAGATAVGMLGAGVAFATIPTSGVISACYLKSGGTLRVIDGSTGSCGSKETSLAWNQTGAQGQQGPQGVQGAPGTAGTNGTNGVDGTDGAPGPAGPGGVSGYEIKSAHIVGRVGGPT